MDATLGPWVDSLESLVGAVVAGKPADWVRHAAKELGEGLAIERRGIGGDASQRQVPRLQGVFEPTQKCPDVIVVGIVV